MEIDLPNEIWLEIFEKCDGFALIKCQLVCKNWNQIITMNLDKLFKRICFKNWNYQILNPSWELILHVKNWKMAWKQVLSSNKEFTMAKYFKGQFESIGKPLPKDVEGFTIMMYNQHIPVVPKFLYNPTLKIKTLNLVGNSMQFIPVELCQLINLKSLVLSNNKLKNIPDEISNLCNLEELYISSNIIEELNPNLGNLTRLRELGLGDNKFKEFPIELAKLTNLKYLNLCSGHIYILPEEFENLKQVKHVRLFGLQLQYGNFRQIFKNALFFE
jgi:hypothetical protein